MQKKIVYDIEKIISEIEECKERKLYFAAITMTMILPNMCSGDKYITWVNHWLGKDYLGIIIDRDLMTKEYYDEYKKSMESSSGFILYKFRCALLHSGSENIDGLRDNRFVIDKFELMKGDELIHSLTTGEIHGNEIQEHHVSIKVYIDCLINDVINAVRNYMNEMNKSANDLPKLTIKRDVE